MAQVQAIYSCSSLNLLFRGSIKSSPRIQDKFWCSKKLDSLQELGGKSSEFNGLAIAHSRSSFAAPCATHAIQAVLGNDKATTSSTVVSEKPLRKKLNKVVLAYSGGLDTSVIVPWLRENYGCEVVCFTADVGQGIKELEGLEAKAKASGACQLVVKDLQEEFVKDYIFPCVRAGAIYERKYLLGTSMARPVIAKIELVQ